MSGRRYKKKINPPKRGKMDPRIAVGARCTWWGPVGFVKVDRGLPVCPECLGVLYEYSNEQMFWAAVDLFEAGGPGVARPHPGYREFTEWVRRRCFPSTIQAALIYEAQTGKKVDIKVEDFETNQQAEVEEVLDEGEAQEEWPDVVGEVDETTG